MIRLTAGFCGVAHMMEREKGVNKSQGTLALRHNAAVDPRHGRDSGARPVFTVYALAGREWALPVQTQGLFTHFYYGEWALPVVPWAKTPKNAKNHFFVVLAKRDTFPANKLGLAECKALTLALKP